MQFTSICLPVSCLLYCSCLVVQIRGSKLQNRVRWVIVCVCSFWVKILGDKLKRQRSSKYFTLSQCTPASWSWNTWSWHSDYEMWHHNLQFCPHLSTSLWWCSNLFWWPGILLLSFFSFSFLTIVLRFIRKWTKKLLDSVSASEF